MSLDNLRFAIKAFPIAGTRPRELDRTMAPHPLSYQELPFDPREVVVVRAFYV